MEPLEAIRALSTETRDMFERMLKDSIGTRETTGACLHAAILLALLLSKFAGAPSRVCGGGPPMDGGLMGKDGVLQGHYWVEGHCASGESFVADITADQFGYAPVVVLDGAAAKTLYFCGDPLLIAEHVAAEQHTWAGQAI